MQRFFMTARAIYLDNAATSFPKPPAVGAAMARLLETTALSPGRAAHRFSLAAAREIFEARERLALLFGCRESSRVVFTANVTEALNTVITGLLAPGDQVITTSMEHNSVMRPLVHLEKQGVITVSRLSYLEESICDPDEIAQFLTPRTRMIVVNHGSNVTGAVSSLGQIAARKDGALLVVDGAQTAGVLDIDVTALGIDVFCFTGHKGLFGPTGTGGFVLGPEVRPRPLKRGGTGSNSELFEQPEFAPDCYEAGTPNTLGIAGLAAGVRFLQESGLERIRAHERELVERFLDGAREIPGITIHGPGSIAERLAVVSFTLRDWPVDRLALRLDREFGIMTRAGLHCAPAAHMAMGTFPHGTVRVSFGWFNTLSDVDTLLEALDRLAAS